MLSTVTYGARPGLTLKAWVLFAGATGTIVKSSGITSVTRTSAGLYAVVFASAASSTNYFAETNFDKSNFNDMRGFTAGRLTTQCSINTTESTGVNLDVQLVHVAIYE